MLSYLHILIRVEDDGSLHALGAFTSKEKQSAYKAETGLRNDQIRLDFYNGPFQEDTKVIYAGHRRWNMGRFQLAGYFNNEGEAWTSVTQDGYVSVLQIDTSYAAEKQLEKEVLERYALLQKRWRLSSYEDLVAREGAEKARANLMLRFYEDALESFKPKTRRDVRALYAAFVLILILPLAIFFSLSHNPDYAENVASVSWLPSSTSDISYYRSKQVHVYEFKVSVADFKRWAQSNDMTLTRLSKPTTLSRYKAYIPTEQGHTGEPISSDGAMSIEQFQSWQQAISIKINKGLIAQGPNQAIAIYDQNSGKAYVEHFISL